VAAQCCAGQWLTAGTGYDRQQRGRLVRVVTVYLSQDMGCRAGGAMHGGAARCRPVFISGAARRAEARHASICEPGDRY